MSVFGTYAKGSAFVGFGIANNVTATMNTALGDLIIVDLGFGSGTPSVGDTIGNIYHQIGSTQTLPANGFKHAMFYTFSTGTNASNVVKGSSTNTTLIQMLIWDVPITGIAALDSGVTATYLGNNAGPNLTSSSFTTAVADEFVAVGAFTDNNTNITFSGSGGYASDFSTTGNANDRSGGMSQLFSTIQTTVTATMVTNISPTAVDAGLIVAAFKATPAFTISGNTGIAVVGRAYYIGANGAGSVATDASGNYTLINVVAGTYSVFAYVPGYTCTPFTSSQTVTSSNLTGVNFTATASGFGAIQVATGTIGNGIATNVSTTGLNTATGDLIYVEVSSVSTTAPTMSDTVGNSYTAAGGILTPSGGYKIYGFYCLSSIGANVANAVKATFGSTPAINIVAYDVTPVPGYTLAYDTPSQTTHTNSSGATISSGSVTTAGADELAFMGACIDNNPSAPVVTPTAGYVQSEQIFGTYNFLQHASQYVKYAATQSGITITETIAPNASNGNIVNGFKSTFVGFSISGSAGIAGATVSYTGTASGSVTADGSGNYTISGLANGSYTITPSKTGYVFSPVNSVQTVSGANITGVNFTATAVYSISGSAGVAGATVSYTGTASGSVTADGSGNYTIPSLPNGTYTVTPSKTGFIFSPTNRVLTISGSNLTGQNFTATAVFSISGNAGACGATVSYSGTASGSVTANGSGDYTISNLVAGSYTITPTKLGVTFSPASSPQTITSSNITGLNFFTVLDGGVILTPVYVNTLTGANQNPLDPTNLSNATFGNMQVLSNVGLGAEAANDNEAYYIGSPALGNDQYASITIHAWVPGFDNSLFLEIRSPDGQDGYVFNIFDNDNGTATIELDVVVGGFVTDTPYFDAAAALPVTCDMFTLMAVGTTVGLFKNATQLVVFTNTKFSSGSALVAVTTNSNPVTNLTVTNFVMGNASGLLPPPASSGGGGFSFGGSGDFNF